MFGSRTEEQSELLYAPELVERSLELVSSRDFWDRSLRWFLWGRAKVDLDFSYFVSFDSEEFRVSELPPFLVLQL